MRKLKGLKESAIESKYWMQATKEEKKAYGKLSNKEQKEFLKSWNSEENKEYYKILDRLKELEMYDTFGTNKELKELPNILEKNEIIQYLVSGMWDSKTYVIVATNLRLIFLDRGMIYGTTKHEIPYEKISSISYKKGMIMAEMYVYHGSHKVTIKNIIKSYVDKMVDTIREQINVESSNSNNTNNNTLSIPDEILKYKELLDEGIISNSEFESKKKELLNL